MVNMIILVYVCIFALTNIIHPLLYISIYIRNAVSIVCVLSCLTQLHEGKLPIQHVPVFCKISLQHKL